MMSADANRQASGSDGETTTANVVSVVQHSNATLRDVAERVGVSIRTVSRVVNDEGGFSEATRARVLEAVDQLGYRPNLLARGLIKGRSGTIALVATELTDPFFPELAEGVQRAAAKFGLTLLVASSNNIADRQRDVLDSLRSHAVDGIILFPSAGTNDDVVALAADGTPTVVIDTPLTAPGLVCVTSEIARGAELATRHLLETGRRRIAMIGSSMSGSRTRERGYEASLPPEAPRIIERSDPTAAGGIDAMRRLLARDPQIDAVFAYNDLVAIGAMKALHDAGHTVPDDVAVVGFDDIDMAGLVIPALTTVHIDRERLGREAVTQLSALWEDPSADRPPVAIPVSLEVRDSA